MPSRSELILRRLDIISCAITFPNSALKVMHRQAYIFLPQSLNLMITHSPLRVSAARALPRRNLRLYLHMKPIRVDTAHSSFSDLSNWSSQYVIGDYHEVVVRIGTHMHIPFKKCLMPMRHGYECNPNLAKLDDIHEEMHWHPNLMCNDINGQMLW